MVVLTGGSAASGIEGPPGEAAGQQAPAQTSRGAGFGARLPRSDTSELPHAASAAARAAAAWATTSTATACSAAELSSTPTGMRALRVAWFMTRPFRTPDNGTPGTAAAATLKTSYRQGLTGWPRLARPGVPVGARERRWRRPRAVHAPVVFDRWPRRPTRWVVRRACQSSLRVSSRGSASGARRSSRGAAPLSAAWGAVWSPLRAPPRR